MNVRIIRRQKINKVQYEVGQEADFPTRDALWLMDQAIVESLDAATAAPGAGSVPAVVPAPRPVFAPASPRWSCCGQRPK